MTAIGRNDRGSDADTAPFGPVGYANPGGHLGIPRPEFGDAVRFLARHLGSDSSDDGDDGGHSTGPLRPPGAFARRDAMG